MSFVRFEEILERTMGLNAASIGTSAIERAVRARLRACELEDADDYWAKLQHSREELQELVEAVVVPETWFFRDPQVFRAMTRIAVEEWLPTHASGILRLLSLPCSTGEEPYTMAMALIDAGVPPDRFRIDAIDISGHAIAQAQRGVYGRNSFRNQDISFRDRHFRQEEKGWLIGGAARGPVQFIQGNLLGPDFLCDAGSYDMVFCRNLLIYFDPDTQNRAIEVLKRQLAPQGMLFVGHSEAGLMLGHGLVSAKIPMAFAFRRTAATQPETKSAPARQAIQRKANIARPVARQAGIIPTPRQQPAMPSAPDIDELRRIADSGQLVEAAQGCEALMRARGPSPGALLLLGLISDARGDPSAAAAYYRKALYLEPDHPEALSHLALLLKKQGDISGAKILNDRMHRLNQRSIG